MNCSWKNALAPFLILALLTTLSFGCAPEKQPRKVVITLGDITDMTGPAAPAMIPVMYAIDDFARHQNSIHPDIFLDIVRYDTKYDPSRDIAGYEWCRHKGAEIMITPLPTVGETLAPFAERDKVPILSAATTSSSSGASSDWVFRFNCPPSNEIKTLLAWVSENHWDYYNQRLPKIGLVGWNEPYALDLDGGLRQYCQDHPDDFEWAGGFLPPINTMSWSGEVERLKDCDYIVLGPGGVATGTFIKQFHAKGYVATFVGTSVGAAFQGFILDMCGETLLDGMLCTSVCRWWNQDSPIISMARESLYQYRPGEAESIIRSGSSYINAYQNACAAFEILDRAIETGGTLDGQSLYNAAVRFKTSWEGYPEWGFTETKRYLVDHVEVYQWTAAVCDLVRVSDWLPVNK